MKARTSTPQMNAWTFAWASLLGGAAACGGHVYDPDVDGQSHWWLACALDAECGPGLSCVCGACTKACDARAECTSEPARAVCVSPPAWCEAPSSAVCAVQCGRSKDCPANHTCEAAVCVPTPPTSAASTLDAPSDADASCSRCTDESRGGERTSRDGTELTAGDAGERTGRGAAASTCGDGIVQFDRDEQCDDANAVDLDGCSRRCTLEPEYACDAGVCFSSCGDGILSPNEDCDDGNAVDADGCSSQCAVEAGYVCNVAGAPCVDATRP